MTAPATPIYIPKSAQEGFVQLKNSYMEAFGMFDNIRQQMIQIDIAYMREQDQSLENAKAQIRNRLGDLSKFQNVTVPIIYPAVETAVEYQTEVFLTGYPIFQFTGAPVDWDAVAQMNVIVEDQSTRGGWTRELMMAFRDGFKYNLLGVECDWDSCAAPVLETDISKSLSNGTPQEVIWSGNVLRRLDPYNTFWDTRYFPSEVSSRGEFGGYHKLLSRTEMKSFINGLDCKIIANIIPALESAQTAWVIVSGQNDINTYNIPLIRQDVTITMQQLGAEPDWNRWVDERLGEKEIKYKNSYVLTVLYARIIPSDFNLKVSAPQTPQIWKMYYVNNQILLGAKRLTNAHNNLPTLFAQPLEDGLGYQTKSLAKNAEDIQNVSSALLNSVIAARRRAISDRTIYDPSRISEQHINSANPSAKIPVRPAAYGKPISESVYAFPFRDDQSGLILQEMQQIMQLGDLSSGQNRTRRGQFQKGNKTLHEYQDVQDNSTGRDRMCSIGLEASLFTPLKNIIKINILQYQGTGVIFSKALQKEVNIDPVVLRNTAMSFNVSDGLLPSSKILNSDSLQQGFQTMAQVPQIAAGYNMTALFSYLMKSANADLTPFEKSPEQLAYEAAAAQWNQAMQLSVSKGVQFTQPQPTPAQFNWDPSKVPGSYPTNPAAVPQDVTTAYQVRTTNGGNAPTPPPAAPIK